MLRIKFRQAGDVNILDLTGQVILGEGSVLLHDTLLNLIAEDRKKILIDLGKVSYIDSSGIMVLVNASATMTNRGGQLKLLNLTERLNNLLGFVKLCAVFNISNDETAAIASFNRDKSNTAPHIRNGGLSTAVEDV